VNHAPLDVQDYSYPSCTGLSDGGWVVTWTGQDEDGNGIFQQRYNAYGLRVGHETRVNTTTANSQTEPTVTALAGGGWVVTWVSHETAYGYLVHQQRYGANGFPVGTETAVDSYRYGTERPTVTALADGGWLVTYGGYGPDPRPEDVVEIFQQRYDADGWTVDYPIQVNTSIEASQALSTVTGLKDGGWVVTWSSMKGDNSGIGILQQRYAINGQKVGTETRVNTTTAGDQFDSSVTALPDGGWLVTWTSGPSMTSPGDIYQQRYAADGQKVGKESRVNTFTQGDQSLASVTVMKDGGWIVSWNSLGQDGDNYGIYQQRYTADGRPVGPTTPTGLSLERAEFKEGLSGASSAVHIFVEAFATDQGFTYTLLDDADGRFALSASGVLTVTDGTRLDYEQARSHQIEIEVKDKLGAAHRVWLTVTVENVVSEVLTGTSNSDVLKGNLGKDRFEGGSGHDELWGGLGNDTLTGNKGRDVFVFDTKVSGNTNKDTIVDFTVKDDSIWFDNAIFSKLGKSGSEVNPAQMKKDFFVVGFKAKDKNDYVIYDKAKGVLFYDADGSGKGKQVEIATLSKKLAMTYKDFFVI
jgi:Ca2+-binding RTX toxin-like protein